MGDDENRRLDEIEKKLDQNRLDKLEEKVDSLKSSGKGVTHPPGTKSKTAFILFGIFLGALGIHNFYAGYKNKALIQLLVTVFLWWLLYIPLLAMYIWSIVDILTVEHDADGNLMVN